MTVDWNDVTAEAVRHLQALIRIPTVNPPGNEKPAADYLAEVLAAEGYDPLVLESAPGRGNVVARYRGSGEARRCCSFRTWTWCRPSRRSGSITPSAGRSRTATSGGGARWI